MKLTATECHHLRHKNRGFFLHSCQQLVLKKSQQQEEKIKKIREKKLFKMSVPRIMPTCSIGNQSLKKTWNWHRCILMHSRKTLPRQNWRRTSICYLLINALNTALQVAEPEQCKPGVYWHSEPRSTGRDLAPSLSPRCRIRSRTACSLLHLSASSLP